MQISLTIQDVQTLCPRLSWAQALAWHEEHYHEIQGVAQTAALEYARRQLKYSLEDHDGNDPIHTAI